MANIGEPDTEREIVVVPEREPVPEVLPLPATPAPAEPELVPAD